VHKGELQCPLLENLVSSILGALGFRCSRLSSASQSSYDQAFGAEPI
jgi:hypothetical protein